MKLFEYRVTGYHPFPHDMLRYDTSFPATSDDAATIDSISSGDTPSGFKVQLLLRGVSCTPERWKSFEWNVMDCKIVEAPKFEVSKRTLPRI